MATNLTMADLLAKQNKKPLSVFRGQEVEGEVVSVLPQEIILDLGTKAEGILQKKDLTPEVLANLKVGDKLLTFVVIPENESGQVILGLQSATFSTKSNTFNAKFEKFLTASKSNQTLKGKGIEVNKGGLIVEVSGIRGFLPSSQVSLSQASNLEELVGQDITVAVIEVDPTQNRLIFSQRAQVSEDTKQKLEKIKVGDKVSGEVAAVLPFGIFVTLPKNVEGLVHISEVSWEKVEDPSTIFKIGDKVGAVVISTEPNSGRVNLSIKKLQQDPFASLSKDLQPDDLVKVVVQKVSSNGVLATLENGLEGIIPSSKTDTDTNYQPGQALTCLIDSVDNQKRRVNLVPFVTSTKDLIYK